MLLCTLDCSVITRALIKDESLVCNQLFTLKKQEVWGCMMDQATMSSHIIAQMCCIRKKQQQSWCCQMHCICRRDNDWSCRILSWPYDGSEIIWTISIAFAANHLVNNHVPPYFLLFIIEISRYDEGAWSVWFCSHMLTLIWWIAIPYFVTFQNVSRTLLVRLSPMSVIDVWSTRMLALARILIIQTPLSPWDLFNIKR